MVISKPYRVSVTLEEYDTDGFWQIFTFVEIIDDKDKVGESLDNIVDNCKKYMEKRGIK